jgi:nucleoside-diphosphate-sugar epimerase
VRIFVTGANGFVGTHLCSHLLDAGHAVTAAVRRENTAPPGTLEVVIPDFGDETDVSQQLAGHDAVIHLAARVHVMRETAAEPLEEFRRVNAAGTRSLARDAVTAGVPRLVFLSSIKVNGESTTGRPFVADDNPRPEDPYGVSKLEAEVALREIEKERGLEIVIVRTPLVYGPGVGGNYVRMLALAKSGLPLPLASVRNARTMTSIWNLVDLLEKAVSDADAAGALVMAGDTESPSTPDLIRLQATAMGTRARLLPFPVSVMRFGARLLRKEDLVDRLVNSLRVDAGSSTTSWRWQPPMTLVDSLTRTAEWYAATRSEESAGK